MNFFDFEAISNLEKIYRINLINSCSGFKSANLLGTISKEGITNVAIFSSVMHLGSDPPTLGFILRPKTVERDTYKNIKEIGFFTINHIWEDIIKDAHHTSAKYEAHITRQIIKGTSELSIDVSMAVRLRFASDRWHNFLVFAFIDFHYRWQAGCSNFVGFDSGRYFFDFSFGRGLALR